MLDDLIQFVGVLNEGAFAETVPRNSVLEVSLVVEAVLDVVSNAVFTSTVMTSHGWMALSATHISEIIDGAEASLYQVLASY